MTERAETRIRLTLGTIIVAVCMIVTGASAFGYVRSKTLTNEENIGKHEVNDEKKWDKALADIDGNSKAITLIQVQSARQETQNIEILRRLDELRTSFERLEYMGAE